MLALFPRLGERIDQSGGALSGGEQQSARNRKSPAVDPAVLMLTSDPGTCADHGEPGLERPAAACGRFSMLVVEQNKTFLHALADEVPTMRGGRLSPSQNMESSHGY